jgi:ABC-type amino acid transport substrate-binding protein
MTDRVRFRLPRGAGFSLLLVAVLLGATPPTAFAQPEQHPPDKPIQVGTDFGIAPFVFRSGSGPEGFSVDMVKEVSRRIRRPGAEIADMNMSGLISALMSKRIEMMVNPFGITAERSERMLFTEPYLGTGNAFIIRKSDQMKGLSDLSGKALAVNRGTISDTWATENAAKYGFEVQRYDSFPDSVQRSSPDAALRPSTRSRPRTSRRRRTRRSRWASPSTPAGTSATPFASRAWRFATRWRRPSSA